MNFYYNVLYIFIMLNNKVIEVVEGYKSECYQLIQYRYNKWR